MTEVLPKFRSLGGAPRVVEGVVLVAVTVAGAFWALGLQYHLPVALFNEQYLGLFMGLGLAGAFIVVKPHPTAAHDSVPWYDWIAAAAALAVGLYIAILYPSFSYTLASLAWDRLVPATIALVLDLESTRRIAVWALMWIALACVLYAKFGWLLPGPLYAKGSSWGRIAVYLYLDSSGILGIPLGVTASIVVAYIFFGQALTAVRGDAFLTGFAMSVMGRYRGGAAKLGLTGLPRADLPRLRDVMRVGWVFLVPLGVLLYTLMISNWEAGSAGMLAVGTTLLVGCLQKATRPSWRGIVEAVEGTGRTMLDLIAITTLAGIVIGAFQLSGLTSKLPILLTSVAGGNVVLLLILTAAVSILLGMSLPTT